MTGWRRAALAGLGLGSVLTLAACDDYGGYGGPAVGYAPGHYDAYYDGYASPYYSYPGYGAGYYGWYGGYYYPGSGYYVYDRFRRPHRWNGDQRHYWQGRWNGYRGTPGTTTQGFRRNPNWGGFNRGTGAGVAPPAGQAFRGGTAPGGGRGFGGGGPGRGGRHR